MGSHFGSLEYVQINVMSVLKYLWEQQLPATFPELSTNWVYKGGHNY